MTAPAEALGDYTPGSVDKALELLDPVDQRVMLGALADTRVGATTPANVLARMTGSTVLSTDVLDYRLDMLRTNKLIAEWREAIKKEDEEKA